MTFSVMAERVRFAPRGLRRRRRRRAPTTTSATRRARATRYPSKFSVDLAAGEVMSIQSGGGGGYGEVVAARSRRSSRRTSRPGGSARSGRATCTACAEDARPRVSGFRVAIDIGGTFTDVVLVDDGDRRRGRPARCCRRRPTRRTGFFRALDLALEQARPRHRRTAGRCSTRRPSPPTRSSPGPAARRRSSRPRGSATCSRSPARSGTTCTTCGRPSRRRSCRAPWALEVRERLRYDGTVARAAGRGVGPGRRRRGCAGPGSGRSRSASSTPTSTRPTSGASPRSCARRCPSLSVSLSSVIAPEIREYPRASTTVANAYVGPVVGGYIERDRAPGCASAAATPGCGS